MKAQEAEARRKQFFLEHRSGPDDEKVPPFYSRVAEQFGFKAIQAERKLAIVVVAHMVHTLPPFLEALTGLGEVVALIPKASGYVQSVLDSLKRIYVDLIPEGITKDSLKKPEVTEAFVKGLIQKYPEYKLVFVDHGGYFAPCFGVLLRFSQYIAALVEHTKNGEVRLEGIKEPPNFPVYSIATSRLKHYENRHVADSIIAALQGIIFSGMGVNQKLTRLDIGIIGCGQIGEAVASLLKDNMENTHLRICEINQERRQQLQRTFNDVSDKKDELLANSDVIICAGSAYVLTREDFKQTKKTGVFIVNVTSSDDQQTADAREDLEQQTSAVSAPGVSLETYRHRETGAPICFVNDGRSINFSIGSTSHPILAAVLASVCSCIVRACQLQLTDGVCIHSLPPADMLTLEQTYEAHFGPIKRLAETFGLRRLTCHFVGREEERRKLADVLHRDRVGVITQSISGVGGIGKSTLADKYVQEALEEGTAYDCVLKLNATDEAILYQEFIRLAGRFGITDPQKLSPKALVQQIYEILKRYRRLLIIFDNAPTYDTLQKAWVGKESVDFMPPAYPDQLAHCIVTTRNQFFKSGELIILKNFTPEEAVAYVKHHLPTVSDTKAAELSEMLGYFPLALCQAVAYLKEHRDCSIDDYIGFYREQHQKRREFLAAKNLPEDPYTASVYTTWNVSRQALEKKNLLSVALLDALAYFAAAPISLAVLAHAGESGGNIDQALQSLMKYSLVDADTQEVRIHELVQEVLRLQQQEKASFRPPLRLALRLVGSYARLLPDISFFILHALSVISFHDDVLPGEGGEEKVQTLYKIGSCYHFDLLHSGAAVKVFEQAKAICDRKGNEPIKRKYFIDIQIGLANSWSGAASPLQYTEMLDQLLNSDDLSISHITTLMRNYGINVDLASAKAKLMELIPLLSFCVNLAPEDFFAVFLTPTFKTLRVSCAPQVLAAIGAKQLAIVYLMFRGNLSEAEIMAENYYNSDGHTASSMVEAISLYVEVKVLRGTLLLPVAIDLLKQAIGLLDAHPDIDRFWTDQIYFILSTIYAAEGKFAESHDTIFRLWEIMVKNMAAAGSEEGLKDRLKNLSKIVGFLEKFISPQTTSLFAQAFRLMGRLLSALKEDAEAEKCYKSSLGYEESILTHYEYGCLLFRVRSRHAEAQLCFESVIVFAMSLGQPINYRYYLREAPTLSRRFRPLLVEETPSVQIPVHLLAYVFLALLCKKNADMAGCETWLIKFADESPSFGGHIFQRLLGIIREKIAKQPKALLADVNEQPGAAPT